MNRAGYEEKKAAVINEITAAFDGVSRGAGVSLHEATVIDDYGDAEARAQAREKDIDTKWQDVPEEDIRGTNAVLNFLDSKGFHYYIPAYLVWYLNNVDNEAPEFWSNTFDSVDHMLAADCTGEISSHYISNFQSLTKEQSTAIAHFLVFMIGRAKLQDMEDDESDHAELSAGKISKEECNARSESTKQKRVIFNIEAQALERYWKKFL